jgi:two-component system chemotaxis sensor kinase CheA
MTLDDLAAAVIGVEPDDTKELESIRSTLSEIKNSGDLIEEAKHLLDEAANLITEILEKKTEDPSETLQNIGQIISSLQILTERTVKIPDTREATNTGNEVPVSEMEEKAADHAASTIPPPQQTPDEAFINDPELLQEFVSESQDHIQNSESALLTLETNPEDADALSAVFRAFHTIKGTAGFLNLTHVQTLAHRAESLLDRARKGSIRLIGGYADLALESADTLKQMISAIAGYKDGDLPQPPATLGNLIIRLENPESYGISETDSSQESIHLRIGDILVAQKKVSRDDLEAVASKPTEKPIGETLVESGLVQASDIARALRTQQKMNGTHQATETTVRVGTNRLDNLINMVGELVIIQSMVAQNDWITGQKDRILSNNVSQMSKITRDLQDLSMSLRMVPLKGTFQKMARLVRDLAKKSGKTVNFTTEGEDTEIDRNMVESLNDPLVHMIRNAVDHGIESSEERIAAGKSSTGTITLRAYHSAGNVVIELHDDGKGLNREKIIDKAIQNGSIQSSKDLSESDIFKLIFQAGLSTAEQVTDISGRGVGMDVVRKNIEAMRGRVDVQSESGKGSIFSLRIPLTLAIIDGMLLKVGEERYIIPTLNVKQAFRPEQSSITTVTGRGEQVMLRGNLLPIFRLHQAFSVENAEEEPTNALLLVVEHEGESCALLADELLGQQQVVIKSR